MVNFTVFLVQWVTFLDNKGRVVDPKSLKKRVFHGGVEPNLRQEVLHLPLCRIKLCLLAIFIYCIYCALFAGFA